MRVVYIIGVVVVTFATLGRVRFDLLIDGYPGPGVLGYVLSVAVAQLVWRVTCEGIVVLFSIHESLRWLESEE